jgi:hypothetical protein
LTGVLRFSHRSNREYNVLAAVGSRPADESLAGLTGFRAMRFEATCPTGPGGKAPHLDLLAEGKVIALYDVRGSAASLRRQAAELEHAR